MFVGNQESIQTLTRYIDLFFSGDSKAPHFIIIAGPQHIGKTSVITQLLKEKMGNYFVTDVLQLKDFSQQLEKKHILKIEFNANNETTKTLIKDFNYEDKGIREVNTRLQQSAIGKYKIAFLENIERMHGESANAFLKTCEEPLPKRLIIATTTNPAQLLETIRSRALIIHFHPLSDEELLQRIDSNHLFSDNQELKTLTINMAMGKPGIIQYIHDLTQKDEEFKTTLISLIHNIAQDNKLFYTHDALKKIHKYGLLDSFLDGRIAYCINHNMITKGQRRLKTKRLMNSNVNIENLLLYGLLDEK